MQKQVLGKSIIVVDYPKGCKGVNGKLPKGSDNAYSQGYRTTGNFGQPLHRDLRKIQARKDEVTKVGNKRVTVAIKDGKLKSLEVNGVSVILERRPRVGKYFSANGGKIGPAKVTVIRTAKPEKNEPTRERSEPAVRLTEKATKANADQTAVTLLAVSDTYGQVKVADPTKTKSALTAQKSPFERYRELIAR